MQLVVSARLQSWYVICSKIAILQKPCRYLWWNFLNSKFQINDVLTEVVNLYFCIRKKKFVSRQQQICNKRQEICDFCQIYNG